MLVKRVSFKKKIEIENEEVQKGVNDKKQQVEEIIKSLNEEIQTPHDMEAVLQEIKTLFENELTEQEKKVIMFLFNQIINDDYLKLFERKNKVIDEIKKILLLFV